MASTRRQRAAALGISPEALRGRERRGTIEPVPVPTVPIYPDWQKPESPDWREWLDAFDTTLELHKRADAIVQRITIDLPGDTPAAIVSASDLHMGGGFTNHKAIKRTMEYILDHPRLYIGITGDAIEGFIPGMKGAASSDQMAGSVGAQLHAMESLVNELTEKGRLLWLTWGDHDAKWFEDRVGFNVMKRLVDKKVPYFQGRGLIKLRLGEQQYFLHVNHGERYKSELNATFPQRKMYQNFFPADVTISGHLHKPAFHVEHLYSEFQEWGLDLGGKTVFVQNGTFKTGPDPYSTRWWSKGIMGVPTIVFSADEHDKDVFESPEKAVAYMKGLIVP